MKVEILEFYPNLKRKNKKSPYGSFGIFLIEEGIDINGMVLSGKKGSHWIGIPQGVSRRHDTGEKVGFPIFKFMDNEKNRQMLDELQKQAVPFLEKWFSKHPEAASVAKSMNY